MGSTESLSLAPVHSAVNVSYFVWQGTPRVVSGLLDLAGQLGLLKLGWGHKNPAIRAAKLFGSLAGGSHIGVQRLQHPASSLKYPPIGQVAVYRAHTRRTPAVFVVLGGQRE
jgi:hypothetical protein